MNKFFAWLKSLFTKQPTYAPAPVIVKPGSPAAPTLPTKVEPVDPPWLTLALAEMKRGVKEIAGSKHNPRIIEYHQATSLKSKEDEVPWCAAFMSWLFVQCGIANPKSARAKDFSVHPTMLKLKRPIRGCVVVYTRVGGGHVDLYISGYATGMIKGLGGNESNTIKDGPQSESSVVGYFWPRDFALPPGAILA